MSDEPHLNLEEVDPAGQPVRTGFPRRALRWVGRHPVLVLFVVGLAVPLGLGLDWWFLPNRPTRNAARVESVTVELFKYSPDPGHGPGWVQEPVQVTINDPAVIQPLLDVFRRASRAEEHKCPNGGTITIRRTDGGVEEVRILPGHDEGYYEYRFGSRINKVPREPLLAALRGMGLTKVKTVSP
jgi:hypothetical protein